MAKKRKRYLVTADKSEAFACSLVTSPAMEETFVVFNEDTPIVEKFADDKKHMITGVVAIPNKPIYRRNKETGEEYDIVFSAEAIEKMSMDFLKNYKQHEVTLQHQENADGVYLVEQWIKNDLVYDKSLSMGLSKELPVGSWFQTYYVDSNDVWKRIESGELLGFSLECALSMEEFNKIENNDNDMDLVDNMNFWKKMKETLKEVFAKGDVDVEGSEAVKITPTKQELAEMSGFTSVEDYEKEVEAIKAEFEEATPTVETPVEPIETPVEAPKVEDPTTTPPAKEETPTEAENKPDEPKDNHLEDLIKNLKEEIEALKGLNKDLNKKVKTLEKEPSVNPINTNGGGKKGGDNFDNWRETMKNYLQ